MGVVYLAIALVSGFIFTNLHIPARYRQKRSNGWDSYFHVAAWGTFFSLVSLAICIPLDYFDSLGKLLTGVGLSLKEVDKLPLSLIDFKIGSWAVATVLIALIFGLISSFIYKVRPHLKFKASAEIAKNDHLESLVLESSSSQSTLLFSLKTRKCYVGICYGAVGHDEGESSNIAILPMLSGYRHSETLCVNFNNNYYDHYEKSGLLDGEHECLTLEHFKIIIPKEQIETASFFNLDTYKEFKVAENSPIIPDVE